LTIRGLRRAHGRHYRLRFGLLLAVLGAALAVSLAARSSGLLDQLELDSVDVRFAVRGNVERPQVVVVAIDQESVSDLQVGRILPRTMHAQVIDRLERAGARTIAYDAEFRGRTDRRDDRALLASLRRARPVVLATHDVGDRPLRIPAGVRRPDIVGARLGSIELLTDQDGTVRQMASRFGPVKSFPVVAAETALGRSVDAGAFSDGDAWIDYAGPPGAIRTYSFARVLRGAFPANAFRGKVVVVGATDPSFKDLFPVPGTADEMAGAEIQANAVATILSGFPLKDASGIVDLAALMLMALAAPAAAARFTAASSLLISSAAFVVLLVAAQLAFDTGRIVELVYPLTALLVGTIGAVTVDFFVEARERRRLRQAFERFVPARVVDEVLARTDDDLRLGGETLEATVMFCDLRGFSAFAERHSAATVIRVLNHYLTETTEAIRAHDGTVVSYMGDGVMAVFGAPIEQPDNPTRAVRAALEIRDERIPAFNRWFSEQSLGSDFGVGIGLCSGPVMSGNVGAHDRLEYAAIGDTTNVAARLQAKNKETGTTLLMADSTRVRIAHVGWDLVDVGVSEVAGRRSSLRLWTIPDRAKSASHPNEQTLDRASDRTEDLGQGR
jgi:adenylate cyclase